MVFAPKNNLIFRVAIGSVALQGVSPVQIGTVSASRPGPVCSESTSQTTAASPVEVTAGENANAVIEGTVTVRGERESRTFEGPSGAAPTEQGIQLVWIQALGHVQNNFDGYGTDAPSEDAVRIAAEALSISRDLGLIADRAVASSAGGVFIYFKSPGRYAHLEVFNDGDIISAWKHQGEALSAIEVQHDDLRGCIAKLNGFINE